jgi:hypothetical protein
MATTPEASLLSRSNLWERKRANRLLLAALGTAFACAGPMRLAAQKAPTQAELNCAGFFTKKPVDDGLVIAASEEVGFKNEFVAGDYVYLNKGKDAITGSGGQYLVVRPVQDVNRQELYPGQQKLVLELGTLYAEIGRIEIAQLHEHSATARIVYSCESLETGDIAIPYNVKATADYKPSKFTDRFAAPSGKATGIIAEAKDFDHWLGEGSIVYLNLGSEQGLKTGSYLNIVRSYRGGGNMEFSDAVEEYPTSLDRMTLARRLTPDEQATMPREVLGEVMVLSAQDGSATGIVTYSRSEVAVGDGVELE